MRKMIWIFNVFLCLNLAFPLLVLAQENLNIKNECEPIIFFDTLPYFKSSKESLASYFTKKYQTPLSATKAEVEGKVFVKFRITKKGKIDSIQVIKGLGFGCDERAVEIIKSMPECFPATSNRKRIDTFWQTTILFVNNLF